MRILITGGAGFIGMNLCRNLLERGHDVAVIDDLSNGHRDNLDGMPVEFVEGSVLDCAALGEVMEGADSVMHLAALGSVPRSIVDPNATHLVNATGTLNVLESARTAGVNHVIVSSSSSVYGMNPALPKSEREWVRPMSPYAVSKLAAEQYTLAYQQSFGLRTLAFRFFNVYGPGQRPEHVYAAVVPVFLEALLDGRPLPVNGDGRQTRDFTYVDTVCATLCAAIEDNVSHPEPVNLAFGSNTSLVELIDRLSKIASMPADVEFCTPRPGDVPHSRADNNSLQRLFPDIVPVQLGDGLAHTLEWFKERQ